MASASVKSRTRKCRQDGGRHGRNNFPRGRPGGEGASFSNGLAESLGDSWLPAAEGEPSPYAPKWVREGRANPGKVVPLRVPAAPQLVARARPRTPHPPRIRLRADPSLLADDAVLKTAAAAPLARSPAARRPGRRAIRSALALGMVARLMVAGCAAAAVAMLLLGVIPLPFRLGTSVRERDRRAGRPRQPSAIDGSPAASERRPRRRPTASPTVTVANDCGGAGARRDGVGPRDTGRRAGSGGARCRRGRAPGQARRGLSGAGRHRGRPPDPRPRRRGARSARRVFARARPTIPAVLKQLHVVGFKPDVAQARAWYEKAADYGSAEASRRLAALPSAILRGARTLRLPESPRRDPATPETRRVAG